MSWHPDKLSRSYTRGGGGTCFSFRKKRNDAIEIGTVFFLGGERGEVFFLKMRY